MNDTYTLGDDPHNTEHAVDCDCHHCNVCGADTEEECICDDLNHQPTPEGASFAAAFQLGYEDGLGDMGMTYDDDPESPRSRAYDQGRTLRRSLEGIEPTPSGSEQSKTWTLDAALAHMRTLAECLKEAHQDEIDRNHYGDGPANCSYCAAIAAAEKGGN